MERSAQGVSRSAEKLARFVVRGNECPTSYEPRPRLFFSPTLFPTLFRSIDRSAPRDRLSNGDRIAVPLFVGKKESVQPTPANTSQKQGQQVSCGYVCVAGVRNVTTHRSRSSRTRDIFPDTSVNVFHGMSRGELVCEFGEEEGLLGCSR